MINNIRENHMRTQLAISLGVILWVAGSGCSQLETSERDGWRNLFNGRDLTGWKEHGQARWSVDAGRLVGTQGPNREPGDLLTVAAYDDFELIVTYRGVWPLNSGVWYRYQSEKQACQADILEYQDPVCYTGSVYCMGKGFVALNEDPALEDREGWNTLRILAEGEHIQVWLNGTQTADVKEDSTLTGRIGFQIHAGDEFATMKLIVKEAKIRPL